MANERDWLLSRRRLLGGASISAAATLLGQLGGEALGATMPAGGVETMVAGVEDVASETFEWGALKWLFNDQLSPGAQQTVGIAHILPGKRNPVHYHPNCEEVLYMISGRGRHRFDDEQIDLAPGMALRIPQGVRHNLENTGWESITCLVAFSSGDRQTVFVK